mmetsp:Transcript_42008/g.110883  ORF Transcript_42008/g.110883 Transcript_42008/m.110883 type:complete len:357 (-) Transcript_42008:131-1201(-)
MANAVAAQDARTLKPGKGASCLPSSCRNGCWCCYATTRLYEKDFFSSPPAKFPGWDVIESSFTPPQIYDPPQLRPGYIKCSCINYLAHRSPLGARPGCPCCCVPCAYCWQPGGYYVDLLEPDEWFTKMLSTGTSPNFPSELLKGIYWMDGNLSGEVLTTFHDANWTTPSVGLKLWWFNWVTDYNLIGCFMKTLSASTCFSLTNRIEVSPNKKWVMLSFGTAPRKADGANTCWMYVPQKGDKFKRLDGTELQWELGDLMRINHESPYSADAEVNYQYMARRVAYLDEDGKLVKTQAYEELRRQASAPNPHPPTCCGYGFCGLKKELLPEAVHSFQNRKQHVVYAPPPHQIPSQETMV